MRKRIDNLYENCEKKFRMFSRRIAVKKKLRHIYPKKDISSEYKTVALPYWRKFGLAPKKYWFELYCGQSDVFDPRFIPDDLWYGHILPYYSNMLFRRPYEDKSMHSIYFSDFTRPKTIFKSSADIFYDDSFTMISRKEAISYAMNSNECIIKPTIDSGYGRLIQFFDPKKESQKRLEEIMDEFKTNYIVQEVVKQHDVLESIYPNSLNTIRVLSFFFNDQVHILSCVLRMGSSGSRVDNVSAGGLQCGIHPDGRLFSKAADKNRNWIYEHPDTKVRFESIQIPSFDEIIQCVKMKHVLFPHFRLIGWDFSVNKNRAPVFIEFNVCPGANQMTCGPTFGELTDLVLKDVFISKELVKAKN